MLWRSITAGKRESSGGAGQSHGRDGILLVIGLGNPLPEYTATRHNVGYRVVEELARRVKVRFRSHNEVKTARYLSGGKWITLGKPITFMNRSGRAVQSLRRELGLRPQEVLVICDEIRLPLGQLRLRPGGSSGGQKGLESVISLVGTEEVPRLRLGIGLPSGEKDLVSFVLSSFEESEREEAENMIARAADCVEVVLREGLEAAMSRFNRGVD